jgi:hypothetical protein
MSDSKYCDKEEYQEGATWKVRCVNPCPNEKDTCTLQWRRAKSEDPWNDETTNPAERKPGREYRCICRKDK